MKNVAQLSCLACLALCSFLLTSVESAPWTQPENDLQPGVPAAMAPSGEPIVSMDAGAGSLRARGMIVKFRDSVDAAARRKFHEMKGLKRRKRIGKTGLDVVDLPPGLSMEEALRSYRGNPRVEYAEPNYILDLYQTPNDPGFPQQWNLMNTGQVFRGQAGLPGADIYATLAWDDSTGTGDVVVAVIDTGIDYTHPDIRDNAWVNTAEIPSNGIDDDNNGYVDDVYGIDVYNGDSDPLDDNGHGTHVAGIIGARGNNSMGVAGIAWNVKIMACKFTDAMGAGDLADATECLNYVRTMKDRGVNIVATSNSYGLFLAEPVLTLYDAIMNQGDILFVAAAGNEAYDGMGTQISVPSSYSLPNIISVASTNNRDGLTGTSNYGYDVDIGAPGDGIYSTCSTKAGPGSVPYKVMSGTSMAAPHVTGVAVLLQGHRPDLSWWQVRNLLLSGGEDIPALSGKVATGKRLSASGALACAESPLLSPWEVTIDNGRNGVGNAVVLSALSVNCADPVGPVSIFVSDGETVDLKDEGIYPDLVAGDGIFSGEWVPSAPFCNMVFSSPAGEKTVFGREAVIPREVAYIERDKILRVSVEACRELSVPPVVDGYDPMVQEPGTNVWTLDVEKAKAKELPMTVTVSHEFGAFEEPVSVIPKRL